MIPEENVLLENRIQEIRPKVIFKLIERQFSDQNNLFSVNIPPSDIGGLTLLENSILFSLMKLINPSEIFEFGTYMGATSFFFANNSPDSTKVTTLDIPPEDITLNSSNNSRRSDIENDNYLRNSFVNKGAIYINRANNAAKSKITQIFHNSLTLNLDKHKLINKFDYIFIDGGHDHKTIKNDTEKAFHMCKDDSIIIWHDYRSNLHTDVTEFIDEFSIDNSLIHVQATMLAISLNGKYQSLI